MPEADIIKSSQIGAVTLPPIWLVERTSNWGRRPTGARRYRTERHESRRIDNQLRGRAGRQGDPGYSRFYLSLDDDLLRRFASDRIRGMFERLGIHGDNAIEHRWISRAVEGAQKRVEGNNFDNRKTLLQYDDVIRQQREIIYAQRREILFNDDIRPIVDQMIRQAIENRVYQFIHTDGDSDYDGLVKHLNSTVFVENPIQLSALENKKEQEIIEDILTILKNYSMKNNSRSIQKFLVNS